MIFLSRENFGIFLKRFFLVVALATSSTLLAESVAENRINWVEVTRKNLSTQIMFDFSHPISFTKKLIKKNLCLQFSFPGMNLNTLDKASVMNQLEKLKHLGLTHNTTLQEKNHPFQQVILSLHFSAKNPYNNEKNKLLIKCSTLEGPNRLTIDIFKEDKLNKLKKDNPILLHASNNAVIRDTPEQMNLSNNPALKKNMRIVIDAGHGGKQPGAEHFGLQEKSIALDIAQRVRKALKQSGFNVLLTRNADATLTLQERSELAAQLKADLFVSIHANAAPFGKSDENGIETFYLDSRYIFPQKQKHHFILMNLEQHHNYQKLVNTAQRKNIHASKNLAHAIQNSLVGTARNENYAITNRGIKQNGFRVLLQSDVPAALVEVGFLTNKKEAHNLAQTSYRTMLAQGICDGIKNYLASQP